MKMAYIHKLKDRYWLSEFFFKTTVFCLYQIHFKYDTGSLKAKDGKRYIIPTMNRKKV